VTVEKRFRDLFVTATAVPQPYAWQERLALREEPARAISAATGAGKTEAVLLDWLWRRLFHPDEEERRRTPRRLLIALPMRVLVEQTLGRVRDALGRLNATGRLSHAVKVYPLMGGAADDWWTLEPEREAVLVGTIDMLLSRALNRGFGRGRSAWPVDFGLVNSDCELAPGALTFSCSDA